MAKKVAKRQVKTGQSKLGKQRDKSKKANHPGKRTSADGNTYYEYRDNRSDKNKTKKL